MSDKDGLSANELLDALKALANPVRLQIMDWLRDPVAEFAEYDPIADRIEVGVCGSHIKAKSGLAQSTVSSYMTTLERAGLVQSTRVGKWTHYRRNETLLRQVGDKIAGNT
ncbi:ArsR/SmtB family transcription factor [Arthrobacter sp. 35W]|uniref:ArsR/SmtB family transcription factor n=1 Tax=Arthrobacter sp. 35W TaxID=1132441 RepID=UPI0004085421|nr:metalloregulator ArsR/SmtB family transcription factor [Arthrobacter sp. 35W]